MRKNILCVVQQDGNNVSVMMPSDLQPEDVVYIAARVLAYATRYGADLQAVLRAVACMPEPDSSSEVPSPFIVVGGAG